MIGLVWLTPPILLFLLALYHKKPILSTRLLQDETVAVIFLSRGDGLRQNVQTPPCIIREITRPLTKEGENFRRLQEVFHGKSFSHTYPPHDV